MIGVNILRTKVLITTDEVIFHAPMDHQVDPRSFMNNIILAERRFIKPLLGTVIYNNLIDNKNLLVTSSNKDALQAIVNEGRGADREEIILKPGDYVNSDTYLNEQQQDLWINFLHKIVAECVWFVALPVNRSRFTSKGVIKNFPESIAQDQESVTIDLKDLKHLLDKGLQERISPLMDDLHNYMCSVSYPGYTRDCGCGKTSTKKQSGVIFGLYDDDDGRRGCCKETTTVNPYPAVTYGPNETIPFENVDQVLIPWNTNRKSRFGAGASFSVEIWTGSAYQTVSVSVSPDDIDNTTYYLINLAGIVERGRVIIS
jgi:hypothetical protein